MTHRYDRIPERYWPYAGRMVNTLSLDVRALELGGATACTLVVLRPNDEGEWGGVLTTRRPGVIYWWQRPLTATRNAPVPQYADGYDDGDMVDPLEEGEHLPIRGVVWSDSMQTSAPGGLAGRAADQYAGGVLDVAWAVGKWDEGGQGRSRVIVDADVTGLDIYDAGVAWVTPNTLVDGYRCSLNLYAPDNRYVGGVVVRAEAATSKLVAAWGIGDTSGRVTWSVKALAPENWAPPATIGSTPHEPGGRVAVTVRGAHLTIEGGGATLTHDLAPEMAALPGWFALASGRWGLYQGWNITLETAP